MSGRRVLFLKILLTLILLGALFWRNDFASVLRVLGKGRADAEALAGSVIVDKLTGLAALLVVAPGGLFATKTPAWTS